MVSGYRSQDVRHTSDPCSKKLLTVMAGKVSSKIDPKPAADSKYRCAQQIASLSAQHRDCNQAQQKLAQNDGESTPINRDRDAKQLGCDA